MNDTPVQLAYRYAQKEWDRIDGYKSPLPSELYRSIVEVMLVTGYKRSTIDKLIEGYKKSLWSKQD